MRVMGFDMGTRTMTVTVVDFTRSIHIVETMSFPNTIDSLVVNKLDESYPDFTKDIEKLIRQYKPSHIYAERFMVRGRFMGGACETISFMLGIIMVMCKKHKIKFVPITAAQWKNEANKYIDLPPKFIESKKLEAWYAYIKPTKPHFLDSMLIAIYGMGIIKNDKTFYKKVKKSLITQLCKIERIHNAK